MKKLFKPLITIVLTALLLTTSVVAQTPSNESANSTDMDRRDNTGKWGLLGLIGLLGFMKMKKTEKTGTYNTTGNPQSR